MNNKEQKATPRVEGDVLVYEYKIPIKGVKKKVIYQFGDSHLCAYDELSTPREEEKARSGSKIWKRARRSAAVVYGEPYEEAQQISAETHFKNLVNISKDGDALILIGDIMDYFSPANCRLIESELNKVSAPILAVRGNYEKIEDIPENDIYYQIKKPVQKLDLGDLVILGFDDSQREMTAEQIAFLEENLKTEKAVIIAMHVPIMTDGNEEIFKKCGEYFQLNYKDACEETLKFIDVIKENAEKISAVFTGHLHFINTSELVPGLTQYVSSQGILGNINRYEIGE